MGSRVHLERYCDLVDEPKHDGEETIETVAFMFDSATREIDLCAKHRTAFIKANELYLAASRKAVGNNVRSIRSRTARGGSAAVSERNPSAVRTWAKEQGIEVNEKGRVPEAIFQQYEAAH